MSANRVFLVCAGHPAIEDALMIGERGHGEQYFLGKMKRADEWFTKHKDCSVGLDHFQLAYHHTPNWDESPPAEATVNGGVRLALAVEGESNDV